MTKLTKKELKHGDILHCKGSRLISRLINRFTGSEYSHTAIVVEVNNEPWIVDAQSNGLNAKSFEAWRKKYGYDFDIHRRYFKSDLIYEQIGERVKENIGVKSYDFWSLLWYQPRYIFSGKWKGRKKSKAKEKFYCSEFVAYCHSFPNWWTMSPKDLFNHCAKMNFRFYEFRDNNI